MIGSMLLHNAPLFKIYFGDAQDKLYPDEYLNLLADQNILDIEPFSKLKKLMDLEQLIFLKQIHSADGMMITKENAQEIKSFKQEGDFLMTKAHKVGLGVMAADCLPIVLFDNHNNVTAIIHAGWRGSVQKIAVKTVEHMQQLYKTDPERLQVFFGPSAKVCCYKVTDEFVQELDNFPYVDKVLQRVGDQLMFDLPELNRKQLRAIGVKKEAFRMQYNICTICDDSFFSYRRQGDKAGRQMTVVSLK
jgi:YfiH family protein